MPQDVPQPNERETGFGTGLRRQLERRRTPGGEQRPEAQVEEETRPHEEESARHYLRRQAEQHADLLWRAFQDGLTALRAGGSADFRIRLEAARSLLAEAYPESAPPERALTPEQQAAQDELAGLRARRAFHQPS